MRLIDADAVILNYRGLVHISPYDFQGIAKYFAEQIAAAPTIDAVPVVSGKWIIHKPFDSGRHNCNECIECSVCGTWFGHDCYEISNFCPNCGADMREEIDHD